MRHGKRQKSSPIFTLLLFAALLLQPAALTAHPHVFIDVMVRFMLTDSSLAGFYVYWDFDRMNSAMIIEEFDKNSDTRFDSSEVRHIETEAFSYAARDNYFISFTWGLSSLSIRRVERFSARVIPPSTVRYSFYVPCDIALDKILDRELNMFFDEPSMFIAFNLKKDSIQASAVPRVSASVSFGKTDYLDRIILTLRRGTD